jgi:predicted phosphoribosyltransferase
MITRSTGGSEKVQALRGFRDRQEAGCLLAEKLAAYAERPDVIVLALPRGGVPVGFEVARVLHAPLDVVIVRKLGVPGQEELAMGAIAMGGMQVLNVPVVHSFGISQKEIESAAAKERLELERRERAYRGGRAAPEIRGHIVILVDDGIATGTTMKVAIAALKQQRPSRIVVAVPVAPWSSCQEMKREVDDVVCLLSPEDFMAIGAWYADFTQVPDQEVCDLLERADREAQARRRGPMRPSKRGEDRRT